MGTLRLVASVICRNELGRYLKPCIESLLTFCDQVRVWDDCSDDGGYEWLLCQDRVAVGLAREPAFYTHEGAARNQALAWAMDGNPTHLLAVDADEIVTGGQAVRAACEADDGRGVWSLQLHEVWKADESALWLREDGGWKAQAGGIPILWRAPSRAQAGTGAWRIPDRPLACGREPLAVRRLGRHRPIDATVLHFGWANEADRAGRYARYVEHDAGRYHDRRHLDSIMWDDRRVRLARRGWPDDLVGWRGGLLARAGAVPV